MSNRAKIGNKEQFSYWRGVLALQGCAGVSAGTWERMDRHLQMTQNDSWQ